MSKDAKKILVIDDDPATLRLLEKRLKAAHGYNVVTALDGTTGYSMAKSEAPDAILLDVMIPDMSGGEVAKLLRNDAQTKDIPIVFISVLLSEQGRKVIDIDGMLYRAVSKPFYQPELLSAIKKAMNEGETKKTEE